MTDTRALIPDERTGPVFIGGTGRSGTTVLLRTLSRLPGLFAYPHESRFLVAPGGLLYLARKGWQREDLDRFLERLRGKWFERQSHRDSSAHVGLGRLVGRDQLEEAVRDLTTWVAHPERRGDVSMVASFSHHLFAPAVAAAGARRWCEKTPRNALFVDRLYEHFPGMRFIHVVRDGRDVVASMLDKQFWPVSGQGFRRLTAFHGPVRVRKAIRYWVAVLALTRRAAARVPPENYLEVRLEDLVGEPETCLRKVCRFLGEDFTEALLEQDLSQHHVGRWRTDLSREQQAAIEAIAAEALLREGYPADR